ncbi:MAG: VanZ family protein [Burkholderiaceae bacterium]|nr:VanZ family protein [Burkholderiaceae bacterium]MEB2351718.1 VanZ family protein [Burkholderiaceae bacterium]
MTAPPVAATGAWLVAWLVAVVYATLYPWSGWRAPGRWMFSFLSEPWPRWWTGFDVAVNFVAYLPIGLLLAAWLARRLSLPMGLAAALSTVAAAGLSLALECAQALLPARVPSRMDLLANAMGGAAGALIALSIGRRRIERWPQWARANLPLAPHSTPGLLLLCGWLVAQFYPQPLVFATGDLVSLWTTTPGQPTHPWLSRWLLPHEFEPFAEAAGVALTVLAVGLVTHDLLRAGARGAAMAVAAPIIVASAIKTAASLAYLGQANAFGWLNAGAQGGLLAGIAALLLFGWVGRRPRLWLAMAALALATALFNLAPPNAYYLSMRTNWGGGAWTNFHGLLHALATAWPFVAIAWCGWRLRTGARRGL